MSRRGGNITLTVRLGLHHHIGDLKGSSVQPQMTSPKQKSGRVMV
jgi:hypothetical protein